MRKFNLDADDNYILHNDDYYILALLFYCFNDEKTVIASITGNFKIEKPTCLQVRHIGFSILKLPVIKAITVFSSLKQ